MAQQRSPRRQRIEPLNYLDMADAPALKGNADATEFFVRDTVRVNLSHPGDETAAEDVGPTAKKQRSTVTPIRIQHSTVLGTTNGPVAETTPGDESTRTDLLPAHSSKAALFPGRGRSKVRRCVLAQDGHSLGEEAIYQVMWRSGRPENADPNASRTVRMGAADLGMKVNMAKKNVRQNIARLFEKLSIEIIETFDTMSSQARLYRVFSYKQILDRRRSAGLTHVLRNKGVLFCSPDGEVQLSSPAYVQTPGDETCLRPARPLSRRQPKSVPHTQIRASLQDSSTSRSDSEEDDTMIVSHAMNRYWAVDEPAVIQLIRSCRGVRPDARAEEIAFFASEKMALARQSRTITNPVGLVLATVPQSFVGKTFESFRVRLEEQRAHEAAEADRKAAEQDQLTAWFAKERLRLEAVVNSDDTPEPERSQAEKELRRLSW